ncbi:hypothetical protein MKK58_00885 [Methylobacterium sp. J-078]|uniref:hypothetical protein n=1 Tax=Methylobacterium sp. J-078 TaxID=2836657 RepID=UPI001FB8A982|nr:hypothetical protein [Methylobacterium sp. J-078]MCJ2043109.1 hypothetical protein [Methylobacterium sp. J-078]
MNVLRPVAHLSAAGLRAVAHVLTAGFDALTGPVGRLSDRLEAHLLARTTLLRAYYARPSHRLSAPLPILDAPADLALRGGLETPRRVA